MAVILSIETSTSVCSAALHENGNLITGRELFVPQSAASQLAVQIDDLLSHPSVNGNPIQAVAVSSGPGSYTGLRIGTATAKGICYALQVPLLAIDSLHVLACSVEGNKQALLCPMIDARRMEVYCCVLNDQLNIVKGTHSRIIDKDSFMELLDDHKVMFFGNGAEKCESIVKHPNAEFLKNIYATASNMGKVAYQKYIAHLFEDLASFEPNYLKDFVAKTKSAEKLL